MEYYIGIDSGGTKTEFILADAEGSVISRAVDSGCNPLDIGVDPAREPRCSRCSIPAQAASAS